MMNDQIQFANARIDCRQSRYQAGAVRQRHYHDSTWVVFTFTGSFALTMRSAESLLTPGSLLYVPAGEAHSNVFGSQGAGVFVTTIDPAWFGDRLEIVSAEAEKPRIAPAGLLTGLALKIYREFRSPDTLSDLIVEGAFLELLGRWLRQGSQRACMAAPGERIASRFFSRAGLAEPSRSGCGRASIACGTGISSRLWHDHWRVRAQAKGGICSRATGAPPKGYFLVDGFGLGCRVQQSRPHGRSVQSRDRNAPQPISQGARIPSIR
jgi:mannose-6-phosphate isomerase-like protein (cupin superfamily)